MRKIDRYEVNLLEKIKKFGVAIIKISSQLSQNLARFTIADQLLRSGTSIGANLIEISSTNYHFIKRGQRNRILA